MIDNCVLTGILFDLEFGIMTVPGLAVSFGLLPDEGVPAKRLVAQLIEQSYYGGR